ncbi:hypothetical protein [Collimonas sp. OK412]|jgi:hypothetical protein|uniref:hypothetical protein n=1 Tax=Collimonas sp. (strain OK412) TaxID=1801619 RepID=UPI0008E0DD3F|nr:hypothetical protein [Collimonas sp. OK412]SFC32408.1 hypothetical protein SAMN04515619_106205 [Collimonas sp. OK412]
MSWLIRISSTGFERGMNAGVITSNCLVTSTSCHTVAQLRVSPNAGKTTSGKVGSNPACQAEQVWQNVLSTLVGI